MPAVPLFVPSLDDLKAGLRLSDAHQTDTGMMIDHAVLSARAQFYDNLSETRIDLLVAIPYSLQASTRNGIDKIKAVLCEIAIVRLLLIRKLPLLFMDGAANARELWNEEQLTRETGSDVEAEAKRLEAEISDYLDDLNTAVIDSSGLRVSSIGPAVTPLRPGESIQFWRM